MMRPAETISHGHFSLDESRRFLVEDSIELSGAQTLDILIEPVPCPNESVSKNDLLARVWLDVPVEEGSLPLHIVGMRKALFDAKYGARYIPTLKERGYCLVADDGVEEIAAPPRFPPANFAPPRSKCSSASADNAYE